MHGSRCFRVKRVRVIVLCSLPSRSLVAKHLRLFFPTSPILTNLFKIQTFSVYYIHGKKLRGKPLAPLAGVGCLVEQLTQLQTQVMSPTPPASSATWTRSTPFNLVDSHHDFPCHGDATVISTMEDSEGFVALRSIQQQQANSSKQSSFNVRTSSIWKQMANHVSGRPGLQETGAISDRESFATAIFSSQSKVKRDRDTNVVHSSKDRANLPKNP